MKRLLSIALLCAAGAVMAGCQASAGVDPVNTDTSHREMHEKTVTDQNGNVIEHEKSVQQ